MDINLRCSECGKDLVASIASRYPWTIDVDPCSHCVHGAYESGLQDGNAEKEGDHAPRD